MKKKPIDTMTREELELEKLRMEIAVLRRRGRAPFLLSAAAVVAAAAIAVGAWALYTRAVDEAAMDRVRLEAERVARTATDEADRARARLGDAEKALRDRDQIMSRMQTEIEDYNAENKGLKSALMARSEELEIYKRARSDMRSVIREIDKAAEASQDVMSLEQLGILQRVRAGVRRLEEILDGL